MVLLLVILTLLGRRANQVTSDFIQSNGLKKATNIIRGEIPTQKSYATGATGTISNLGIPTEINRSPIRHTETKIVTQEITSSPQQISNGRFSNGGLGVVIKGGIQFDSRNTARPIGKDLFKFYFFNCFRVENRKWKSFKRSYRWQILFSCQNKYNRNSIQSVGG